MKKSMISLVVLMAMLGTACINGTTPVDNPSIMDRAPTFEKTTTADGQLTKAGKVALKTNGYPELQGPLTDYKGGTRHMRDFKGKPKLISFWASWCGPCIKEKPLLKALSIKYPQVEFLSISVDEEISLAEEFFKNRRIDIEPYDYWIGYGDLNPLKWYTLRALDDGTGNAAIVSLPTYVLIDAHGRIISNDLPKPSSGQLEAHLDKM